MPKALLPKAKRSWLRPLLPAAMAGMTTIVVTVETAVAHRLKSLEMAAAASRLQNLEVTTQVLAAMAASRLQSPASD